MAKRSWTSEEKENFIKEARIYTVSKVLKKYKLSSSLFYTWKKRYEAYGLQGLESYSKKDENSSLVLKELIRAKERIQLVEEQLLLHEELISKMSVSEIPISERAALVRKYNKKGLQLIMLFDICKISKRRYYIEINNLRQSS